MSEDAAPRGWAYSILGAEIAESLIAEAWADVKGCRSSMAESHSRKVRVPGSSPGDSSKLMEEIYE